MPESTGAARAEPGADSLRGVPRTLLIPLYAKALDYRSPRSILGDASADRIVRSLDADFEAVGGRGSHVVLAERSRQLDEWTRAFLARHPDALALHLGCGLDARVERIGPPATSLWIDVDYPEVIAVRRRFYAEGIGRTMLGTSLTAPGWIEALPSGRPTIAIADGVLPYLAPEEVGTLLRRITAHFGGGAAVFDIANSFAVERATAQQRGRTGVTLRWAVDDLAELDAMDPRLHRQEVRDLLSSPRLPFRYRFAYRWTVFSPRLRHVLRLVRAEF